MRGGILAIWAVAVLVAETGCSDDGSSTSSAAGTSGGNDGGAGVDGATDTGDGAQAFMAVAPCNAPGDYVQGTSITVSADAALFSYTPACLAVGKGAAVQLGASALHPLSGTDAGTSGNPIPVHQTTPRIVNFPVPGFYTFQCDAHADAGMNGVVWVTP